MKPEELAQWVIDNRYPKSENNKVSDLEMYHFILDALTKQKLPIHSVMQAEGSDVSEGAAVGNSAAGQSGRVGCVHNTLKYIGPWYSCEDCGTHFNARAEAPPEGALPF